MSLLLDALKKAALDKKNRDQQLGVQRLESEESNAQAENRVNVLVSSDSTMAEKKAFDEGEDLSIYSRSKAGNTADEAARENASEQEQEVKVDPALIDDVEELEFNANEFEVLEEQATETLLQLENDDAHSDVMVENELALEQVHSEEVQSESTAEFESVISYGGDNDNATLQEQESIEQEESTKVTESASSIQPSATFSLELDEEKTQRQKEEKRKVRLAAIGQLIQRKRKAEKFNKRKRLFLLAVLILLALLFVGFYYYYLNLSADSQVLYTPPSASRSVSLPAVTASEEDMETLEDEVGSEEVASTMIDNGEVESSEVVSELPKNAVTVDKDSSSEKVGSENSNEKLSRVEDQSTSATVSKPATASPIKTAPIQSQKNETTNTIANENPTQSQRAVQGLVARKEQKSPLSQAIDAGYKAWQEGDWSRADQYYREALAINPQHRDAVLGAAAVALALGQEGRALNLYQQRLALAPGDEYALAGIMSLASLQGKQDEIKVELQNLLRAHPEAAHLYYLRASIFAREKNWTRAQGDFFEAWKRDGQRADYVFNLAVSMDHLGLKKEALHFYLQAEQLARNSAHNFSLAGLQTRISQLQAQSE